jgi:hypothetical protein
MQGRINIFLGPYAYKYSWYIFSDIYIAWKKLITNSLNEL